MSVTIRPYQKRGRTGWEVDIRIELPDGTEHRLRRRSRVSSKSGSQRWGEHREWIWYEELKTRKANPAAKKEVPTLEQFAPRFVDEHPRAEGHKPSGIAAQPEEDDGVSRLRSVRAVADCGTGRGVEAYVMVVLGGDAGLRPRRDRRN